jgi:hypothetical protein
MNSGKLMLPPVGSVSADEPQLGKSSLTSPASLTEVAIEFGAPFAA